MLWFESMAALAEVLNDDSRALLRTVRESQPASVCALAEATGLEPGRLMRTLRMLANYGLVDFVGEGERVRPVVNATSYRIVMG
ncbi:HVO_A0114 family putative DNA-binding protein [Pseudomonas chlororaphis]|uniref:HVO_A0114 family putative DNA-binding protein n=1 Tax=Pseudomonas chlororaphis TaxID=587753 RepID=UPI001F34ED51|nr:ArsR family transcriptional regulator [Pseudomonas chlororaphis]